MSGPKTFGMATAPCAFVSRMKNTSATSGVVSPTMPIGSWWRVVAALNVNVPALAT